MKEVCQFVKDRYEPWKHAELGELEEYFRWYNKLGILGVVTEHGNVSAVGTARCFHHKSDYWTEFCHDPRGIYVKVSLYGFLRPIHVAMVSWQVMAQQDSQFLVRGETHPDRIYLWHRRMEVGPPREYSEAKFHRFLRRFFK